MLAVFSQALLSFLGTLAAMADDNARDRRVVWAGRSVSIAIGRGGILGGRMGRTRVFRSLGALQGGSVLLESSLRSLLEQDVDADVQIVRRHVVVNDSEALDVNGALVATHVVGDLGELTLLLDHLDRLAAGATL